MVAVLQIIPELASIVSPANAVTEIRACLGGNQPASVSGGLLTQAIMVYEYAGVVAIKQMGRIVSIPTHFSLSISLVAEDAVRFLAAYQAAKTAVGNQDLPYARSLLPTALNPLDALN